MYIVTNLKHIEYDTYYTKCVLLQLNIHNTMDDINEYSEQKLDSFSRRNLT